MNYTLNLFPGRRGFLKRSPMFAVPRVSVAKPSAMVAGRIRRLVSSGTLRPGGQVPSPERLSAMTGVSRQDCLEAVSHLLEKKVVRQEVDGQLFVADAV
ncbi:MAG: GntR family transcriptional regulator [Akkermansiaceae bacterium]|nr:GntR family transcriptional regulator [Akkermansiaceae bacterium]NNM29229.1 GntR family transcriptional regulator [Akkermansiaceae bacterium]